MKTWQLNESRARPGWHTLIGPVDRAFFRDLRQAVSRCDREWLPVVLAWRIRDTAVEAAQQVINEHTAEAA